MGRTHPRLWQIADLVGVALAAFTCVVLQLVGLLHGLVGVCLGLLLVLILPGYSLTSLLFPTRHVRPLDRVALTIGLSLAVAILSGVVLNLFPFGIQPNSAALSLGGISLVLSIAAIVRRLAQSERSAERGALLADRTRHARLPFVYRSDVALGGVAILVVVAAIGVAVYSASQRYDSGFTELWIQPVQLPHKSATATPQQQTVQASSAPATVTIGIHSEELTTKAYTLEVYVGATLARTWDQVTLTPGQTWQRNLTFPVLLTAPQVRVYVTLTRLDRPGVYRHVIFWIRP